MNNKIVILFITLLFVLLAAVIDSIQGIPAEENGILQGRVSIGPLCPVEPCNIAPEQLAKVYGPRKVIVYDLNTKNEITKLDLDQHGEFSLSLRAGKYLLDVTDSNGNELPLEQSRPIRGNLRSPKEIEITAGRTARVTLEIDTGIR